MGRSRVGTCLGQHHGTRGFTRESSKADWWVDVLAVSTCCSNMKNMAERVDGDGGTHPLKELRLPPPVDLKANALNEVGTDNGDVAHRVCFEIVVPLVSQSQSVCQDNVIPIEVLTHGLSKENVSTASPKCLDAWCSKVCFALGNSTMNALWSSIEVEGARYRLLCVGAVKLRLRFILSTSGFSRPSSWAVDGWFSPLRSCGRPLTSLAARASSAC